MITQFKIFDNTIRNDTPYKVGDYVKTFYWVSSDEDDYNVNYFKILDIVEPDGMGKKLGYIMMDVTGKKHHLNHVDISRKMKPKEIKEFELRLQTDKYNL